MLELELSAGGAVVVPRKTVDAIRATRIVAAQLIPMRVGVQNLGATTAFLFLPLPEPILQIVLPQLVMIDKL
jgi:hypothetical protein